MPPPGGRPPDSVRLLEEGHLPRPAPPPSPARKASRLAASPSGRQSLVGTEGSLGKQLSALALDVKRRSDDGAGEDKGIMDSEALFDTFIEADPGRRFSTVPDAEVAVEKKEAERYAQSFNAAVNKTRYLNLTAIRLLVFNAAMLVLAGMAASTLFSAIRGWETEADKIRTAKSYIRVLATDSYLCVAQVPKVESRGGSEKQQNAQAVEGQGASVLPSAPMTPLDVVLLKALLGGVKEVPAKGKSMILFRFDGVNAAWKPLGRNVWSFAQTKFMLLIERSFWNAVSFSLVPVKTLEIVFRDWTLADLPRSVRRDMSQMEDPSYCRELPGVESILRGSPSYTYSEYEKGGVYATYSKAGGEYASEAVEFLSLQAEGESYTVDKISWWGVWNISFAWGVLVFVGVFTTFYLTPFLLRAWEKKSTRFYSILTVRLRQLIDFGAVKLDSGDTLLYIPFSQLPKAPLYEVRTVQQSERQQQKRGLAVAQSYFAPLPELKDVDGQYGAGYCHRRGLQGQDTSWRSKAAQAAARRQCRAIRRVHAAWRPFFIQNAFGKLAQLDPGTLGGKRGGEGGDGGGGGLGEYLMLEEALAGNIFLVQRIASLQERIALAVLSPDEELLRAVLVIQKAWKARQQVLRLAGSAASGDSGTQQLAHVLQSRKQQQQRAAEAAAAKAESGWHSTSPFQLLLHECENFVMAMLLSFIDVPDERERKKRGLQLRTFLDYTLPKVAAIAFKLAANESDAKRQVTLHVDSWSTTTNEKVRRFFSLVSTRSRVPSRKGRKVAPAGATPAAAARVSGRAPPRGRRQGWAFFKWPAKVSRSLYLYVRRRLLAAVIKDTLVQHYHDLAEQPALLDVFVWSFVRKVQTRPGSRKRHIELLLATAYMLDSVVDFLGKNSMGTHEEQIWAMQVRPRARARQPAAGD